MSIFSASPSSSLSNRFASLACLALVGALVACSSDSTNNQGSGGKVNSGNGGTTGQGGSGGTNSMGGSPGQGGSGNANGGSGNGGASNGGSGNANGGSSSGGSSNGGSTSGGASNGGSSNGGGSNGGAQSKGGSTNGGGSNGGSSNGGSTSGGSQSKGGASSGGSNSGGASSGGTTSKGGASSGGAANGGSGGGSTGVLKIMAVGDSITGSTCWRAMLWQTLTQTHPGRFEFVGTLKSDAGCSPSNYDQDNQGYGSSLVTEAVAGVTGNRTCQPHCPTLTEFADAFTSQKPDVVLLHYATNDIWQGTITATQITNAYGQLVDKMRAANANVKVLAAKIIPMHVTSTTCSGCTCASCGTAIPALNTAIESWAASKGTTASPIIVVDQYTGFDADADTRDGVHPKDSGSQKMAAKWATALEPLF